MALGALQSIKEAAVEGIEESQHKATSLLNSFAHEVQSSRGQAHDLSCVIEGLLNNLTSEIGVLLLRLPNAVVQLDEASKEAILYQDARLQETLHISNKLQHSLSHSLSQTREVTTATTGELEILTASIAHLSSSLVRPLEFRFL